jgi:hypothetical protein
MRWTILMTTLLWACSNAGGPGMGDDDGGDDDGGGCICGDADGCCPSVCELTHDPDCPAPACVGVGEDIREARTINPPPNGNGVHGFNAAYADGEYGVTWYGRFDGAYFARADAEGELVPGSIVHLQRGGLFPRIAYNGERYGVVYSVEDPDAPDPFIDREVHFALLEPDGTLVAGSPRRILGPGELESPALAWNPAARQWAVVWEDEAENRVGFVRLDETGAVVAGSEGRLDSGTGIAYLSSSGPTTPILWSRDAWVVTWAADTGAAGTVSLGRLGPNGNVQSVSSVDTVEQPFHPAAVWTGDAFAVTWTEYDTAADRFAVQYALADGDATFGAAHGAWLHDAGHAMGGTATWDGARINAVWWSELSGDNDIWLARLWKTGTVDEQLQLTDLFTDAWAPSMIWDGCQHVVSYQVGADGSEGRLLFIPAAAIEIL